MSKTAEKDFFDFTRKLVDDEVQVVTVEGTYYGRLVAIERDFLLIESKIRGKEGTYAMRFEKIIGIAKMHAQPVRRPLFFGGLSPFHHEKDIPKEHESSSSAEKL